MLYFLLIHSLTKVVPEDFKFVTNFKPALFVFYETKIFMQVM